jgi:protein required for attachment to host cells
MSDHPVLVVAADEHAARMFVRAGPEAALVERAEFADSADLLDRHDPHPSDLSRIHGRVVLKARAKKSEEELEGFVHRVAASIDRAVAATEAGSLAISAPPNVMRLLRDSISLKTRALLASEMCADLVREPTSAIDKAMKTA